MLNARTYNFSLQHLKNPFFSKGEHILQLWLPWRRHMKGFYTTVHIVICIPDLLLTLIISIGTVPTTPSVHLTLYAKHILYTCCTHTVHILYTYCTHTVHMLYTCCTHAVHMLYTCCTHAVHILYTYCTHAVHMLYTCCTHAVHMLYTCCTHTVHILYTYCTHTVHILYTYCTYLEYGPSLLR